MLKDMLGFVEYMGVEEDDLVGVEFCRGLREGVVV